MNRYKKAFQSLLLGGITFVNVSVGQADVLDIADVPLFLGGLVQPNIMFTLDDSGSMQWDLMPDSLIHAYFVYPRVDHIYGGSDYTNYVPDFDASGGNSFAMAARSSAVNKIYYNPNVSYSPWSNADGSLMANADPACAPHNPYIPDIDGNGSTNSITDCRNLTADNTQTARWVTYDGADWDDDNSSKTFWPAVYYTYNGGGIWDTGHYDEVEIRNNGDTYNNIVGRSDCAAPSTSCTYGEEIQNFANWYTYYRSRILLARAGVGKAFSEQGTDIRVGFSSLNYGAADVDAVASTGSLIDGVRPFSGADRTGFFDSLYGHVMPAQGTPLRWALDNVGQYFERPDNRGPWGKIPGTNDAAMHLTCRQSYNILMTDGYWNGAAAGTAGADDADDVNGLEILGPNGQSFQYVPANPYQDGHSDTLADVAMYYWNRDLRPNLSNHVPTNLADEAFWQHLVNFTVGLGVTGSLDPATDLPDLTDGTLSWPDPTTNPAKVDDLWHAAVNSRGGFFSAANPTVFANALSNTLTAIAGRTSSAAAIATNSARLDSNTYVYQARFDSSDWHGELFAFKVDDVTGDVLKPDPVTWSSPNKKDVDSGNWEAGALLMDQVAVAGGRNLFSFNSATSNGITFEWDNLSAAQKLSLGHGDLLGSDRLDYLAGVQDMEASSGGPFRTRASILGDIVDSDPWFVGTEDYGYSKLSGAEGTRYVDYRLTAAYRNRPGVIYVGANDGMLHGFDATTGEEHLAYIPGNSIADLWELTDPGYSHRYFVNASAKSSDVYIGGSWKTYLVGTVGAGGKTVFALDVTDPENFAADDVAWEFTPQQDDADEDGAADGDLGYTLGQASVVRLANGSWGAVFGNGYASDNQHAVLFIVDIADGSIISKIDTGAGGNAAPNGLSTPLVVDYNRDGIADRIYAGDLLGNMWSFDITDGSAANWISSHLDGSGDPKPLFIARDESDNRQPITAKAEAKLHPAGGVMLYFGTGKYFEVGDGTTATHNTFYAIRDTDSVVADRDDLLEQKITHEFTGSFTDPDNNIVTWDLRVSTKHSVDWSTQDGWYMDLALQDDSDGDGVTAPPVWAGERVISVPLLLDDRVVFSTMIPDPNPCAFGGTGWLMELSAADGARLDETPFDLNNSGTFDADDYVTVTIPGDPDGNGEPQVVSIPVSGKKSKVGIIKTPAVIRKTDKEYKYTSGSSGNVEKTTESTGYFTGRQSWKQIR